MKSRILALILVLCMMFSLSVFAEETVDTAVTMHTGVLDGNIPDEKTAASGAFYYFNGGTYSAEANCLGGKAADDSYIKLDSSTFAAGDSRILVNSGSDRFQKKYFVISLNIYGNSSQLISFIRTSDGKKPYFTTIAASKFNPDKWNNVKYVYEVATTTGSTYLNGVKIGSSNMKATAEKLGSTKYAHVNQLRLNFDTNKIIYLDDLAAYSTDVTPTTDYGYVTEDSGLVNKSGIIVVDSEVVNVTCDENSTARLYDSEQGKYVETETAAINVGSILCLETHGDYGNVYKYFKGVDANASATFIEQSAMGYQQGGSPKDSEGAAIADTRYDVESVYGSGMTMKFMGAGINASNSTQTYSHTTWNKAVVPEYRYLVFEADFAFPAKSGNIAVARSVNLSTNGGTTISSTISPDGENANRVNHFVWVYDIVEGKYDEYLNGELYSEDVAMDKKFVTGEGTAIRFSVNGSYEANTADKTKLYGGYMANIKLYECNKSPEIKKPIAIPGKVYTTLPVTASNIKLADVLALFDEADRDNVKVYGSRSYNEITDPEAYVPSAAGVVITEKDGVYDYARISWAPSEGADYALETLQLPSSGTVYAGIMNFADSRNLTPILVRYDKEGKITDIDYTVKECKQYDSVAVSLGEMKDAGKIELYVWDGINTMKPLGKPFDIK